MAAWSTAKIKAPRFPAQQMFPGIRPSESNQACHADDANCGDGGHRSHGGGDGMVLAFPLLPESSVLALATFKAGAELLESGNPH